MNRSTLIEQIKAKQSFLCVGLDPDMDKIPMHLLAFDDPVFEFNKAIIDATAEFCVAYKPNIAFYECLGSKGWISFEKTVNYIPKSHFILADAKRGDIGNSSNYYAKTYFETYNVDGVTVSPYMGNDSIAPFLHKPGKWAVILALTSNEGALDFQVLPLELSKKMVFERILQKAATWGSVEDTMFVVGATKPGFIERIRELVPDHFLLIPGVGAQGGDLAAIARAAMNDSVGILINSSRSIIYAGSDSNFGRAAGEAAAKLQKEMAFLLDEKGLL